MLLRIEHETRLTYSEPVSESVIEVRMAPLSSEDQTVLDYRLRSLPAAPVTCYRDGFGNRLDLFNVLAAHREIVVRALSYVRTHRRSGTDRLAFHWDTTQPVALEAVEYLAPSPLVERNADVAALAEPLRQGSKVLGTLVEAMFEVVRGRLKYEKKVTDARTSVSEALALGRGVCQDFTHLMLGLCRALGLPARYVSGYINQPGEIATHAWCQVWAGATGWVDVDPTLGEIVGDNHVVTALGRDFSDVPPNRGVWKGVGTETMHVSVKVEAVERMPGDWGVMLQDGPSLTSGQSAAPRLVRVNGSGYRSNVRLLYRHQQEQQQQN